MTETAMSDDTIERYARQYLAETKTEMQPSAMDALVSDIRTKMLALGGTPCRDGVREATRAVLCCRAAQACLRANT